MWTDNLQVFWPLYLPKVEFQAPHLASCSNELDEKFRRSASGACLRDTLPIHNFPMGLAKFSNRMLLTTMAVCAITAIGAFGFVQLLFQLTPLVELILHFGKRGVIR